MTKKKSSSLENKVKVTYMLDENVSNDESQRKVNEAFDIIFDSVWKSLQDKKINAE